MAAILAHLRMGIVAVALVDVGAGSGGSSLLLQTHAAALCVGAVTIGGVEKCTGRAGHAVVTFTAFHSVMGAGNSIAFQMAIFRYAGVALITAAHMLSCPVAFIDPITLVGKLIFAQGTCGSMCSIGAGCINQLAKSAGYAIVALRAGHTVTGIR